jgi:hypothetical protein
MTHLIRVLLLFALAILSVADMVSMLLVLLNCLHAALCSNLRLAKP